MKTTRRRFLRNGAILGAGCGALGTLARTGFASEGTPIEPGLQLYTVRALLEAGFAETLEAVAALGYREVQVSPRGGHTPSEIRKMLDAAGLKCPSIHFDLAGGVEAEIEAAGMLGASSVFLSAPIQVLRIEGGKFLGIREDVSLDVWRAIADELNETGAKFKAAGIVYGYHNHAFEFAPIEGVVPFDFLLERTDPELVAIELDLGWLQVAAADPLDYIQRYPGRFPVCHVKDVNAHGSFVDPGQGTVDFARTFAHSKQAGLEHFFVEHDTSEDPLATAAAGFNYLKQQRAS